MTDTKEDFSLFGYFLRAVNNCLAHKVIFSTIVFIPIIIVFVMVMWFIKPIYSAEAIVTPPSSSNNIGSGLGKLLDGGVSGLSSVSSILGKSDQGADIVWTFFNSWELHNKVIEKFDLANHYEFEGLFHADLLKAFRTNFNLETNDENMFHLTFEDEDYVLASKVLQFMLVQADSMFNAFKTSQARQSRMYMDTRLQGVKNVIDSLQNEFVKFQKENGVYDPESQLESTMKYLSTLQSDRDAVLIEISYEEKSRGENSKRYEELKNRLKSIDEAISKAVNGNKKSIGIVSLSKSPDLFAKYMRMESELKIQQTIYTFLRQESEQLYMEENNMLANLVVLQPPWENNKKVYPVRGAMLAFTGLVSFVLAVFVCCFIEFCKNIEPGSTLAREINRLPFLSKKG